MDKLRIEEILFENIKTADEAIKLLETVGFVLEGELDKNTVGSYLYNIKSTSAKTMVQVLNSSMSDEKMNHILDDTDYIINTCIKNNLPVEVCIEKIKKCIGEQTFEINKNEVLKTLYNNMNSADKTIDILEQIGLGVEDFDYPNSIGCKLYGIVSKTAPVFLNLATEEYDPIKVETYEEELNEIIDTSVFFSFGIDTAKAKIKAILGQTF